MCSLKRFLRAFASVLVFCVLTACEASLGYEDVDHAITPDAGDGGASGGQGTRGTEPNLDAPPSNQGPQTCTPAMASDHIPARINAMTRSSALRAVSMSVDDLFEQFKAQCVGCHVDAPQGGFQIRRQTFQLSDGDPNRARQLWRAVELMRSNDPEKIMPPKSFGGKPFTDRPSGDPVVELASLMEDWLKAGAPYDVFFPANRRGKPADNYFLSKDIGEGLTNLGNCIPSASMLGTSEKRMQELDAKFASMAKLPARLEETDMVSLDSAELAKLAVVAFAPAYTLWADDAKKIRYIRVPRGESIKFDAATQSFKIPPNTRFYKTFLKEVIDRDGRKSYRKMETRVIVARPDLPDPDGKLGPARSTALFGTYAWNEEENEALLVEDPLRNGKPFRDRITTYPLNEKEVDALVRSGEKYSESELTEKHLIRKYAIPGSERCLHCHMGAPDRSFVLGFLPVQIKRRPLGEGGVIEPAGPDELNQLQRLIDYGVITGIGSAEEIAKLESPQGVRPPRNEHEVTAQGYMLGNCAHCHNPRGFPSWAAPELTTLLDFMPSERGGIYQFPLDRVSPRVFRGPNLDIPIPYISPSLYDLPSSYRVDQSSAVPPKVLECQTPGSTSDDTLKMPDFAPWRSLIYRNVSAPFSYSDDFAIFPHMPRDTPGFDCRAQQVLGSWMVSINAMLKPGIGTVLGDGWFLDELQFSEGKQDPADPVELRAQTYVESRSDDPLVATAAAGAAIRLFTFRESGRYLSCPDKLFDTIDPGVKLGLRTVPDPEGPWTLKSAEPPRMCTLPAGVMPNRPHYFVQDLTDTVTETWYPRRADWSKVLMDLSVEPLKEGEPATVAQSKRTQRAVIKQLTGKEPWPGVSPIPTSDPEGVRVDQSIKDFAATPFPMGLWRTEGKSCDFGAEKKVRDFPPESRPLWMSRGKPLPGGGEFGAVEEDAPVYMVQPGAQVFSSICANCHGQQADSRGRMADTVADLTGGETRVANLRDGLFGPGTSPGSLRATVFPNDDVAARYLVWMGLGGTERAIPKPVLQAVANTQVLGRKREGLRDLESAGANMLALAEFLCGQFGKPLDRSDVHFDVARGMVHEKLLLPRKAAAPKGELLPLFSTNGDFEFWQQLCAVNNPLRFVRVVTFVQPLLDLARFEPLALSFDTARRTKSVFLRNYPAERAVGDHRGRIQSNLSPSNLAPWCVVPVPEPRYRVGDRPGNTAEDAASWEEYLAFRDRLVTTFRSERGDAAEIPYCPEEVIALTSLIKRAEWRPELQPQIADSGLWASDAETADWARRGAMNAGLVVFTYLDALTKGQAQPVISYDRCEDRK